MNERIRELAEQAGYTPLEPRTLADDMQEIFLTKFAELIVRESINVVNKRYMGDNNREDFEVRRCVEDLKNYFGVE